MKKCSCYQAIPNDRYGLCNGTRDRDICGCEGNECNCDFYPEKRKAAQRLAWCEGLKRAAQDLVAYAELATNEGVDFGEKGNIKITIDIPLNPDNRSIKTNFAMSFDLFHNEKGE
jgi:hypothetical protein